MEKRGPVRDKTHVNIMLGARLGSFQINLQFCWPSPKGLLSTWYIFATMVSLCLAAPEGQKDWWNRPARMTPHRPFSEPDVVPQGQKWHLCPSLGESPQS